MGISQARTLDKLDADRRKAQERKQSRADSSYWQRPDSRSLDWSKEKNFRYNYGARRDPNYRPTSQVGSEEVEHRRPARERLSFSKDDVSSARNEIPRITSQPQRTEWRPVVSGSKQDNNSKAEQSQVSHTPSPRP